MKSHNTNSTKSFNFFLSCPKGLEKVLAREVREISPVDKPLEVSGGLTFSSSLEGLLRIILHSRIANHAYMMIHKFPINHDKDLYRQSYRVPWKSFFHPNQSIKVQTKIQANLRNIEGLNLKNSVYLSQVTKDGIVDNFREVYNLRPTVDLIAPQVLISLHIGQSTSQMGPQKQGIEGQLYLKLNSAPLYKRGYRISQGPAPLKENLAAGLIKLSRWNPETESFIDPMCGSGTLPIEAALIRAGIPPSFLKVEEFLSNPTSTHWHFQNLKFFNTQPLVQRQFKSMAEEVAKMRIEGQEALMSKTYPPLIAMEQNRSTLQLCLQNMRRARIAGHFVIKHQDGLLKPPQIQRPGVLICNPPYGERMEEESLDELYHQIGECLKNHYAGLRSYIFTGVPQIHKKISLQTQARTHLYNGKIPCKLLQYDIWEKKVSQS